MFDATCKGKPVSIGIPFGIAFLFFLIGIGLLLVSYSPIVQPGLQAEAGTFEIALPIASAGISGIGAIFLAYGATWRRNFYWSKSLRAIHQESPWKWRPDWHLHRVHAEHPAGHGYFVLWGAICILAAASVAIHQWNLGGRPSTASGHVAFALSAIGFSAIGIAGRKLVQRAVTPRRTLHLVGDTGVVGGTLEGSVHCHGGWRNKTYHVRLICERHSFTSERMKLSEHKEAEAVGVRGLNMVHDKSYRVSLANGVIPVHFAIPPAGPATSADWLYPAHFWFIETESDRGEEKSRFWVPIFLVNESSQVTNDGPPRMYCDSGEESPSELLERHGVHVQENNSDLYFDIQRRTVGSMTWGFLLFGFVFICLASYLLFSAVHKWSIDEIGEIASKAAFGALAALVGLFLFGIAIIDLFEHREVWVSSEQVKIRASYFGIPWTSTIRWQDVERVKLEIASSQSGEREKLKSVVAVLKKRKGSDGPAHRAERTIMYSLPSLAASAAKTLLAPQAISRDDPEPDKL